MRQFDKLKLPKDITQLMFYVRNEDGTPMAGKTLHKNKWRKEYNLYYEALLKDSDKRTIFLMDMTEDNVAKRILFQEPINQDK